MMRLFLIFLLFFTSSLFFVLPSVWAGEFGANRQSPPANKTAPLVVTDEVEPSVDPEEVANRLQPSGAYYNQLDLHQPQFQIEVLNNNHHRQNGGIGNGEADSYYCSGRDERNDYRGIQDMSSLGVRSHEGTENRGDYQRLKITDKCRMEGCGPLVADGSYNELLIPTHATNCHSLGRRRFFDTGNIYESNIDFGITNPGPRRLAHNKWEGRNYINDRYGFIYGRYLLKKQGPESSSVTSVPWGLVQGYNTLDVPYSRDHLRWGYLCPEIWKVDGYRANPKLGYGWNSVGGSEPMEGERYDHYLELLRQAKDQLARGIAQGGFGSLYPRNGEDAESLTANEREMSEVVVTLWQILDEMVERIDRARCSDSSFACALQTARNILSGLPSINLHCGPVEGGLLVGYDKEENRLNLSRGVCADVLSKRATGSHAYYNTGGNWQDGHGFASYGVWLRNGGLFDRGWDVDAGYRVYDGGSIMKSQRWGSRPAEGYSPLIVAEIAHQLVHAHFQENLEVNGMEVWPSGSSVWEEQLATIARGVVYWNLCSLGYCPMGNQYEMTTESFIRTVEHSDPGNDSSRVVRTTNGTRYMYSHECRGYGGIFLGPLCNNLMVLGRLMVDKEVETARLYSLYHSFGPILDTPLMMTLDGEEEEFAFPEVTLTEMRILEDPIYTPHPIDPTRETGQNLQADPIFNRSPKTTDDSPKGTDSPGVRK
jgi:hypothetical protein